MRLSTQPISSCPLPSVTIPTPPETTVYFLKPPKSLALSLSARPWGATGVAFSAGFSRDFLPSTLPENSLPAPPRPVWKSRPSWLGRTAASGMISLSARSLDLVPTSAMLPAPVIKVC